VRHLGLFPAQCFPFKKRQELRTTLFSLVEDIPEDEADLGEAPERAYLKLTKEQAVFIYWRVKKWEVSWGWGAKSITETFIVSDDDPPATLAYDFSYPAKTYSKILPPNHLTPLNIDSVNERNLVCKTWFGGVPRVIPFDVELAVTSLETNNFDPILPVIDFSRNEIGNNNINIASSFLFPNQSERGIAYDAAWVPDDSGELYWPFFVGIAISISSTLSDNILFDEANQGGRPPIRGNLETNPLNEDGSPDNDAPSTSFNVTIELEGDDKIELPLFDVTEPSPLTGTRFNVDSFTGLTIKPHSYWPYDPGDGEGPIYDSTTGEQLRAFPA
jgi:hypothetical protein